MQLLYSVENEAVESNEARIPVGAVINSAPYSSVMPAYLANGDEGGNAMYPSNQHLQEEPVTKSAVAEAAYAAVEAVKQQTIIEQQQMMFIQQDFTQQQYQILAQDVNTQNYQFQEKLQQQEIIIPRENEKEYADVTSTETTTDAHFHYNQGLDTINNISVEGLTNANHVSMESIFAYNNNVSEPCTIKNSQTITLSEISMNNEFQSVASNNIYASELNCSDTNHKDTTSSSLNKSSDTLQTDKKQIQNKPKCLMAAPRKDMTNIIKEQTSGQLYTTSEYESEDDEKIIIKNKTKSRSSLNQRGVGVGRKTIRRPSEIEDDNRKSRNIRDSSSSSDRSNDSDKNISDSKNGKKKQIKNSQIKKLAEKNEDVKKDQRCSRQRSSSSSSSTTTTSSSASTTSSTSSSSSSEDEGICRTPTDEKSSNKNRKKKIMKSKRGRDLIKQQKSPTTDIPHKNNSENSIDIVDGPSTNHEIEDSDDSTNDKNYEPTDGSSSNSSSSSSESENEISTLDYAEIVEKKFNFFDSDEEDLHINDLRIIENNTKCRRKSNRVKRDDTIIYSVPQNYGKELNIPAKLPPKTIFEDIKKIYPYAFLNVKTDVFAPFDLVSKHGHSKMKLIDVPKVCINEKNIEIVNTEKETDTTSRLYYFDESGIKHKVLNNEELYVYPESYGLVSLRHIYSSVISDMKNKGKPIPSSIKVSESSTGKALQSISLNDSSNLPPGVKYTRTVFNGRDCFAIKDYHLVYGAIPKQYAIIAKILIFKALRHYNEMPATVVLFQDGQLEGICYTYWHKCTNELATWRQDDKSKLRFRKLLIFLLEQLVHMIKVDSDKINRILSSNNKISSAVDVEVKTFTKDLCLLMHQLGILHHEEYDPTNSNVIKTNTSNNIISAQAMYTLKTLLLPKIMKLLHKTESANAWNYLMAKFGVDCYMLPHTMVSIKAYMGKLERPSKKNVNLKDLLLGIKAERMAVNEEKGNLCILSKVQLADLFSPWIKERSAVTIYLQREISNLGTHLCHMFVAGLTKIDIRNDVKSPLSGTFVFSVMADRLTHHGITNYKQKCGLRLPLPAFTTNLFKSVYLPQILALLHKQDYNITLSEDAIRSLTFLFKDVISFIISGPIMFLCGPMRDKIQISKIQWGDIFNQAIHSFIEEYLINVNSRDVDSWSIYDDPDIYNWRKFYEKATILNGEGLPLVRPEMTAFERKEYELELEEENEIDCFDYLELFSHDDWYIINGENESLLYKDHDRLVDTYNEISKKMEESYKQRLAEREQKKQTLKLRKAQRQVSTTDLVPSQRSLKTYKIPKLKSDKNKTVNIDTNEITSSISVNNNNNNNNVKSNKRSSPDEKNVPQKRLMTKAEIKNNNIDATIEKIDPLKNQDTDCLKNRQPQVESVNSNENIKKSNVQKGLVPIDMFQKEQNIIPETNSYSLKTSDDLENTLINIASNCELVEKKKKAFENLNKAVNNKNNGNKIYSGTPLVKLVEVKKRKIENDNTYAKKIPIKRKRLLPMRALQMYYDQSLSKENWHYYGITHVGLKTRKNTRSNVKCRLCCETSGKQSRSTSRIVSVGENHEIHMCMYCYFILNVFLNKNKSKDMLDTLIKRMDEGWASPLLFKYDKENLIEDLKNGSTITNFQLSEITIRTNKKKNGKSYNVKGLE